MSELEDRIRKSLDRAAGAPRVHQMPFGTTRRVRTRQGVFVAAVAGAIAAVVLISVGGLRGFRAQGEFNPARGGHFSSAPPLGGPPRIPTPAPGAWPDVTYGGDFTPYIDHESDNGVVDPGLTSPKLVVLYGTVQGVPWSETSYLKGGPCGDIFLGPYPGEYGGGTFCLTGSLGMLGFGFGSGPIAAYAGVVPDKVARVEIQLTSGETREVRLVPAPGHVDAKYFIVWPPNGARGRIVAYGPSGKVLADADLCVGVHWPPPPNANLGC
jgi:hypothetical protein